MRNRAAWWVVGLLAVYGSLQYRYVLGMSFVLDDYTILAKVSRATFGSLWTAEHPLWRWYRPWSRELHFWAISRGFGTNPLPFHLAGFALWIGVLTAYFLFVRRVQGERAGAIALLGAAALAAWGSTLGWAAGAQELWMLLFALLFLHAVENRNGVAAWLALVGALLSKETALVLPAIALVYCITVDREGPAAALRRVAPQLVTVVLWAMLHPFLRTRLAGAIDPHDSSGVTTSLGGIVLRSLLSAVNLDRWPAPDSGFADAVLPALPAVALLAAAAVWGLRRSPAPAPPAGRTAVFFAGWAALALVPLLRPTAGYSAYYALLAALGVWGAMSAWLARRPGLAVAVVAIVATLQPIHGHTPSFEWGSDYALRRTDYFTRGLVRHLKQRHPQLPPHSRIYFANVPLGTGIGESWFSPALRVWYRDSTVFAGFVRDYVPRRAAEPADRDFFFRFDDASHAWYETVKGPEDPARERRANPQWEMDHGALAILLGRAGDWRGAAEETAKLVTVAPANPQYAFNLSICLGALGDSLGMKRWRGRADSLQAALATAEGR